MKHKEETKAAPISQNVDDLIEGARKIRTHLEKTEAPQPEPGVRPKPTHELRISTFVGEVTIVSTRKEKLT